MSLHSSYGKAHFTYLLSETQTVAAAAAAARLPTYMRPTGNAQTPQRSPPNLMHSLLKGTKRRNVKRTLAGSGTFRIPLLLSGLRQFVYHVWRPPGL